ncbi:MAG: acyltransferase [Firmicutes bacterium]|nr:acyltransferase [Bacillota bacterium]
MSNIQTQTKSIGYFRLLRVLGCIGIVILHTYYVYAYNFEATFAQKVASYAIRNLQMWAVPCFVMVSGALLLEPERPMTIKKIYSRYMLRALLALLIFSIVFYLFDAVLNGQKLRLMDLYIWFMQTWTDKGWTHMWYLYMLVALYAMLPLYRKVSEHASDQEIRYLLIIYAVFQILISNLNTVFNIRSGFYIGVYTIYPFYFFLGYALHKEIIRIPRMLAAVFTVLGVILIGFLTWYHMNYDVAWIQSLLGNYSFLVIVLLSVGIFTLIKGTEEKATDGTASGGKEVKKQSALVRLIDENSFGIYLVHMMFLKIGAFVIKFNPYPAGGIWTLLGITLIVFLLSLGLTWVLRKIPGMKRVL